MSADSNAIAVQFGLPRRGLPAARSLRGWLEHGLSQLQIEGGLCVRLVDADEGRQLNADYRGKHYATNVLSFPADLDIDGERWLGDLVLCAPVIAREAAEQGKRLSDHYAHLLIHGLLHLLGHDHQDEAEAHKMEALEVRLLSGLGIGDPYL